MSEERPARPSDIARAALEAARAASAARPQPTRRRIAGPRRKWTGAGPGADDPQLLGRLVDSLVTEQDWSQHTRVGSVFGRWSALVGPEIAAHCAPADPHRGRAAGRGRVHGLGHAAAAAGPVDPRQAARAGRRGRRDPVARCRTDGPQLEEGPALGARAGDRATPTDDAARPRGRRRRRERAPMSSPARPGDGRLATGPRGTSRPATSPTSADRRKHPGDDAAPPAAALAAGGLGPPAGRMREYPAPPGRRDAAGGTSGSGGRARPRAPSPRSSPTQGPTWSGRRAGRCSTAGRSPTAPARRTPSWPTCVASAPCARARTTAPAGVLRGRAGHPRPGRLRHRLPAGPLVVRAVRDHRGAAAGRRPAASGSPRRASGGTAPAAWSRWPAATRRSTRAGCCWPPRTTRSCSAWCRTPRVQGLLLGSDDGDEFWSAAGHRRRHPARRPPAAADRAPRAAAHRVVGALTSRVLTSGLLGAGRLGRADQAADHAAEHDPVEGGDRPPVEVAGQPARGERGPLAQHGAPSRRRRVPRGTPARPGRAAASRRAAAAAGPARSASTRQKSSASPT